MNEIRRFHGEYRWLSNFSPAYLVFGDWHFETAEHAYQAAKSNNPIDWRTIQKCGTPGQAKRAGRTVQLRPDFEEVKLELMEDITRAKYQSHTLRNKLLATGDAKIIEENHWGDTFWGVCKGDGENHLGRIIMKIRSELQ